MLTREDDVDAHALHGRGWSISVIARHLGHDRKTIRAYLHGGRVAGQRRRAEPAPFAPFAGYCRERLAEDPHLWATTLFDELLELGYDRSYPTFMSAAARPWCGSGCALSASDTWSCCARTGCIRSCSTPSAAIPRQADHHGCGESR
jgi:hypothetical protein